jgi:hypothetical protein
LVGWLRGDRRVAITQWVGRDKSRASEIHN